MSCPVPAPMSIPAAVSPPIVESEALSPAVTWPEPPPQYAVPSAQFACPALVNAPLRAVHAVSLEPLPAHPSSPRRHHRRRWRASPLLVAGLVGVLIFAGLSRFGRDVRPATPIAVQLDNLLKSAGLAINEVSVSGHRLTLDSDIYAALRLEADTSILGFDVAAARRRIEDIAWVQAAQVARVLPDKLRVEIVERRPIALWRNGEQQALIDGTGRVLAHVAKGSTPALPVIAGTGAPEAAAELLAALELHPAVAQRVETAMRVGQRRWSLTLNDGTIIHLPETSAREALRRLADLDRRAGLLKRSHQTIDLRLGGLVAIGAVPKRASAETSERPAIPRVPAASQVQEP